MVGTKSRGYANSGRLSEGEYLMPFFSTRHSPNKYYGASDLTRLVHIIVVGQNTVAKVGTFVHIPTCANIVLYSHTTFYRQDR